MKIYIIYLLLRYKIGVHTLRNSQRREELPNARLVSTTIFDNLSALSLRLNQLYVAFGQFIAHDLALSPSDGKGELFK